MTPRRYLVAARRFSTPRPMGLTMAQARAYNQGLILLLECIERLGSVRMDPQGASMASCQQRAVLPEMYQELIDALDQFQSIAPERMSGTTREKASVFVVL